jgi:hypothetical protein
VAGRSTGAAPVREDHGRLPLYISPIIMRTAVEARRKL